MQNVIKPLTLAAGLTVAGLVHANAFELTGIHAPSNVSYYGTYPVTLDFDFDLGQIDDMEIVEVCLKEESEPARCVDRYSVKWVLGRLRVNGNWVSGGTKDVSAFVRYRLGSYKIKETNRVSRKIWFGY